MPLLRFLFSPQGRSGRDAMAAATLLLLLVSLLKVQLIEAGAASLATVFLGLQLVAVWTAWVAVPVRRFHDMERSWWWIAVFWGAGIASMGFVWVGLAVEGRLVDMSAAQILADPQAYLDGLAALNAANPDQRPLKPLGGTAMGGVSLAMIFLIIQFGWLHFIPGTAGANKFGPCPRKDDPNAIGD